MIIFFSIFFLVYGAINYYIFIRGWQALALYPFIRPFYLIFFLVFALSYIVAKVVADYIPAFVYDCMLWTGSFWFAFMSYFLLSVLLLDLIRLFNYKLNFFPILITSNYQQAKFFIGAGILLIVTVIIIAGFINTRNIVSKTIDITVSGVESRLKELNIVMASDLHISTVNDNRLIAKMVNEINSFSPDVVLLAGDIVDDNSPILSARGIGTPLKNIKSKYGVYACTGNHEFINGVEESVKFMEQFAINVLRDSLILIDNSFYIAARDDSSKNNFTGSQRKTLTAILENRDKAIPAILLDHTPFRLSDAVENHILLQLSGHTHHGQIFPGNLITKMVYEISWGYGKKGNTHIYVSSGAGTWGPPVRTAGQSEVVNIRIKFN